MQLVTIRPDAIDIPPRLRDINPDRVKELAISMGENGQIQPIEVRPGEIEGRYWLNVGAHRLTVARMLGWTEIAATVFTGTADEARLREIDENLYRHELSPLDQAAFLAERREIYERVFGAVTRGKPKTHKLRQLSFFDDVTERFGLPKSAVFRALARIRRIDPAAWKALRGTKFAEKGVILDGLARLDPLVQRQVVDLLLGKRAGNVAGAIALLHGTDARIEAEKQFAALQAAWRRAGKTARARFTTFLKSNAA